MVNHQYKWLLDSDEPWTRYRLMIDILEMSPDHPQVQTARSKMIAHPQVQKLIADAASWPGYAIKRHNDAKHPIYKFSTLADFGIQYNDPGMSEGIDSLMERQSPESAFQILINLPKAFGGTGEDQWTWVLCDTPTILYILLTMGKGADPRVKKAVDYLSSLVDDNGYNCRAAPDLGKFKGPGKCGDPCPIANVYMLKALSMIPDLRNSPCVVNAVNSLLSHWELRGQQKFFLFGIGTDFKKIKYPFVWYDILHVVEVLSRFPAVYKDKRFLEMLSFLLDQGDEQERFTASSMYRAWGGWSFANKKEPSPWLSFLVHRIQKRVHG
jgi:hypothetical protein